MPADKQSKNTRKNDTDAQLSQAQSQGEKAAAQMSIEDKRLKVDEVVKFLLIMDQKKLPIKKLDINKNVLKDHSKAFPVIIKAAAKKLKEVFGIKLIELEDKFKGSFVLVNLLEIDAENSHLQWTDEENSKTGLLMLILSLIFMNGNVIEDTKVWSTLKKLGVDADVPHEVFGDVKKLVTEFVRQGYLEVTKQMTSEVPVSEMRWGQRAKVETSKMSVLQFVSQVYDVDPEQWRSQHQDAMTEEGGATIIPEPGPSRQR